MNERDLVQKIIEHQKNGKFFEGWMYISVACHFVSRDPFEVFAGLHEVNRWSKFELAPDYNVGKYFRFPDESSFSAYLPFAVDSDVIDVVVDRDFKLRVNANYFDGLRAELYADDTEKVLFGPLRELQLSFHKVLFVSPKLLTALRSYDWNSHQDAVDQMLARRFSILDGCRVYQRAL